MAYLLYRVLADSDSAVVVASQNGVSMSLLNRTKDCAGKARYRG